MNTQYKYFYSEKDVNEWYSTFKNYFPCDSDEDKTFLKAIESYTGNANTPINKYLRNGEPMEELGIINEIYQYMCANLPSYQIPDNVVTYRYISHKNLMHMTSSQHPKKGMIIKDSGFMSTTLLKSSIYSFLRSQPDLNILLEIYVPKGTPGIYVGHLDCTEQEYEIILPPNTKLRIDKMPLFFNNYFRCSVVE